MRVHVGSVLYDYTGGRPEVEARGSTLAELLADLERRHPGLRFRVVDEQDRIRPHMRIFIGPQPARGLAARLEQGDEVHILGALSGG
jgi:molybdopterin converting factor small subunit